MAAIDQSVFGGLPLDLSFGIGQHFERLADQGPALVAGNMRQRIALGRSEGNRGGSHTLHRHGNCSGWSWHRIRWTASLLRSKIRRGRSSAWPRLLNSPLSAPVQSLSIRSGEIMMIHKARQTLSS